LADSDGYTGEEVTWWPDNSGQLIDYESPIIDIDKFARVNVIETMNVRA
jgi:hypothetical protein